MISNPSLYRIHHLERLPLKTPYPAQVERIRYIRHRLPRDASLVVDYTGVGKGIFDMLVDYGLDPIGVTIHSGMRTSSACQNRRWFRRSLPDCMVASSSFTRA